MRSWRRLTRFRKSGSSIGYFSKCLLADFDRFVTGPRLGQATRRVRERSRELARIEERSRQTKCFDQVFRKFLGVLLLHSGLDCRCFDRVEQTLVLECQAVLVGAVLFTFSSLIRDFQDEYSGSNGHEGCLVAPHDLFVFLHV
jgi:hypothetical protein